MLPDIRTATLAAETTISPAKGILTGHARTIQSMTAPEADREDHSITMDQGTMTTKTAQEALKEEILIME